MRSEDKDDVWPGLLKAVAVVAVVLLVLLVVRWLGV
jgi:hypothetical protein